MDEKTHAKAPASGRLGFSLGGAVVALCLAILTVQTWRKWGDMLVDFGVQLYLPWKLSTGAVLYRDVAYLTGGPLSQYYHALLFRVFGVSLLTIVVSNLVILVLLLALVYVCFYRISDAWTATVAGLALVLVFAFAQYRGLGIFNYVSPYSHEIVHGLVLSIAVLWLLSRWLQEERIVLALLAGIGSGLVLLTKPEIFLALALAQAAALALFWKGKHKPVLLARSALSMAGGAVLPPAAFFLYFIQHESFRQSLRSVLWAWTAVLRHAADNEFYRWCLGLTAPAYNIKMILIETASLAAILGVCAALCLIKRPGLMGNSLLVLAALEVGNLALAFNWGQCGYVLPALCLASLGLFLWQARKKGLGDVQPLPLLWGVFSLALLAKLGIYPRLWHYGFVLAMPAFLDAVYFLLWQLPSFLESHGAQAVYFRAAVSLGLLIGMGQLWLDSRFFYDQRTAWVGQGAERMLVFKPALLPSGVTLGRVAGWIQTHTPPHSTLAVLPDGSMLNYLLRRDNPTGYLRWNLAESTVFGQVNMNRAFMRSQPDYIVLIEFNISQFGLKPFGQDPRDGLELKQWINAHYQTVYETGPPNVTVYQRGLAQKE
jgi:4-amino-4-deoxy-L-arabinose transferase-like glycosyltransferase